MFQLKYYKLSKYFSYDLTSNVLHTKRDKFFYKYLKIFYRRKFYRFTRQVKLIAPRTWVYNTWRKKYIPSYSLFLYNQTSASIVRFRRRLLDNFYFFLQYKGYIYSHFLVSFNNFLSSNNIYNIFLLSLKKHYHNFFFLGSSNFFFKYNFMNVYKFYILKLLLTIFNNLLYYKLLYKSKFKNNKHNILRFLAFFYIYFFFFRFFYYNKKLNKLSLNWRSFYFFLNSIDFLGLKINPRYEKSLDLDRRICKNLKYIRSITNQKYFQRKYKFIGLNKYFGKGKYLFYKKKYLRANSKYIFNFKFEFLYKFKHKYRRNVFFFKKLLCFKKYKNRNLRFKKLKCNLKFFKKYKIKIISKKRRARFLKIKFIKKKKYKNRNKYKNNYKYKNRSTFFNPYKKYKNNYIFFKNRSKFFNYKIYKLKFLQKNLLRASERYTKGLRHFLHTRERKSSFLFSLHNLRKRVFRKRKKRNYRRFYLNKIIAIKIFKVFYSFKYTFLKNLLMKIDTSYIYKNIFFNFIVNLNFRLNILLKNFCFFYSLNEINQFIIHGYIYVNNVKITYPTYLLKETDVINIFFLFKKFPIFFLRFFQVLRNRRLFKYFPLYMEFDFKTLNLHINKYLLFYYMCNMKPKLRYYFLRHFFFT